MRWVAMALSVATMAFVPPKWDVLVDVAGVYEAHGTHPDGSTYQGKATINRLSPGPAGERYEIIFDMPSGVFRALCLRPSTARDVLGCGWGSGNDLVVSIWSGGSGLWTADGTNAVGRENLGHGIGIDGVSYDATVSSTPYGAVQRVAWSRGSTQLLGWGLRSGPFLIAGFPAFRTGAAFYRIGLHGMSLAGDWMDPNMPMSGIGTESLTR